MRRVISTLLVLLAIPGAIFGFLREVPPHYASDPFSLTVDTTWVDVLPLLLVIPPVIFVARAVLIVVEWLRSGPRPGPRARP